ncbi:MAG: hypothetical protein U5O16_17245 [Rhodococcus sp. (in: high G+C Gram-positive bacteria)]|nr:hypothetical protein [Rhodococcus sp. (in: high G+C Gram-positive bacteria)]
MNRSTSVSACPDKGSVWREVAAILAILGTAYAVTNGVLRLAIALGLYV